MAGFTKLCTIIGLILGIIFAFVNHSHIPYIKLLGLLFAFAGFLIGLIIDHFLEK